MRRYSTRSRGSWPWPEDALLVQVGAGALGGGEQVVADRVVDDGLRDHAALLQRDRDAVVGVAVQEIGGAVDRIDDPDVLAVVVQVRGRTRFLAEDGVVGVGFQQRLDDGLFRGLVDVGNEVVVAFFADGDAVEVERSAVDDGRGAAGGLDGRVEHGMHKGFRKKNADAHRAWAP